MDLERTQEVLFTREQPYTRDFLHANTEPEKEEEEDDMANSQETQSTQEYDDPRRHGFFHDGLSDRDVVDTLILLHPSSTAALRVVQGVAERAPQHVMQQQQMWHPQARNAFQPIMKTDIALRFTSSTVQPCLGFTFGRNPHMCDIILDMAGDSQKRISNVHFRIFVNNSGVTMLQDMSTNGTFVDGHHLKGKSHNMPATRMLNDRNSIQIPSQIPDETIVFTVRVPNREPFNELYLTNLHSYFARLLRLEDQEMEQRKRDGVGRGFPDFMALRTKTPHGNGSTGFLALMNNKFGMHWNGGEKYNVVGQLGKGAFATVYRIASKQSGVWYAAKELEKKRFMKEAVVDHRLDNELAIMKAIKHPNVVDFVDYHEEPSHLYIIMELVPGGDLQTYLGKQIMRQVDAQAMTRQVLSALVYLHSQRITHRDIKPDNILIASLDPFVCKLSDFGLSKIVKNNETFLKTFCGTLLYCAPEVFPHYDDHVAQYRKRRRGEQPPPKFHSYSHSVDIWSFAAVLWSALCGSPPFQGVHDKTGRGMFDRIMHTELDITPLKEKGISSEAIDMLLGMLKTDPAERLTEKGCLRHPWIYEGQSMYDGMDSDLSSIAEEDEESDAQEGAEQALSQLSITGDEDSGRSSPDDSGNHRPNQRARTDDEYDDDEDLDDLDEEQLNWMINRNSQAVKSDTFRPSNQIRDPDLIPSSSAERSEGEDGPSSTLRRGSQMRKQKLFGEISAAGLQSSGALGQPRQYLISATNSSRGTARTAATDAQRSVRQSTDSLSSFSGAQSRPGTNGTNGSEDFSDPSLLGAESLVRDMDIESPASVQDGANGDPRTPQGTQNLKRGSQPLSSNTSKPNSQRPSQEITPKAVPIKKFNRLMDLPIHHVFSSPPTGPPQATDLNSVAEQSSPISDLDPSSSQSGGHFTTRPSVPPTELHSFQQSGFTSSRRSLGTPNEPAIPYSLPAQLLMNQPKLGILSSTTDSFAELHLSINNRTETWGRNRKLSIVHPDSLDTRIPKLALAIFHHASGIANAEENGEDWTTLDNLVVQLRTQSSAGIYVNGVKLDDRSADRSELYGNIYTGDVITIYNGHDHEGAAEALRFVCTFYHGLAKEPRPKDGPAFEIRRAESKVD